MLLTPTEIELLRFHLGYGNLAVGAYPWSGDGFFELFTNVIQPWLSDGPVTSATTPVLVTPSTGPVIATITPLDMTGIAPLVRLIVDCDDDTEILVVKSTTSTTFTAKCKLSHDASGYPVAVETGTSKLRYLLHQAGLVHTAMFGPLVTFTTGLASADKGDAVWIGQNSVLKGMYAQYCAIVAQISSLVRVDGVASGGGGPATRMEAY